MHSEVPQFTRCCFCIPLRRGLIGWGYIRLVIDALNILNIIMALRWLIPRHRDMSVTAFLLVMAVAICIDFGFTVLLIYSGHTKSAKFMRVAYIYGLAWLGLVVALSIFFIVMEVRMMIFWADMMSFKYLIVDLMVTVALITIGIIVQAYVVLLTRSEMIKLQNQSLEMEFSNHAADGEARCVRVEKPDESVTVVDI